MSKSLPAITFDGADLFPAASSATTVPPLSLIKAELSLIEYNPSLFAVTEPNSLPSASKTEIFAFASALPVTIVPS